MAPKEPKIGLALVLVSILWQGAWAQSSCTTALTSLSPCLNFVTGNSTLPSSSCCSQLTGVVQNQPQCLCSLVNSGGPMAGFAVNQTLALALPAACNVQTPPVSQCNAASGPTPLASSPVGAPEESPSSNSTPSDTSNDTPDTTTPTTPSQTETPSAGGGSKTVPSTTNTSSGTSIIKSPIPVAMFLLLTGSFALMTSRF